MAALRSEVAHDNREGAALAASAALENCFRKLRLEFLTSHQRSAALCCSLLVSVKSKVNTAGPEKESAKTGPTAFSEGEAPFEKWGYTFRIRRCRSCRTASA